MAWTTTSFTDAHVERERGQGCSDEGATEQGRASECVRALEKARARGGVAGKCAVVGVSTADSACGSGGGTVLTGGAHRTERAGERIGSRADERGPWVRERMRVCTEEIGAKKLAPLGSERERERASRMALTGGVRLSGRGRRARTGLGRAGPVGLN
jgi:hypothetical protein